MPNLGLDDPHDEAKLLEQLRSYRARTGDTLTVVFDAGQSYQPAKRQKRGGITVQFVSHGQTADQIIIRRLRKIQNPREIIVVTSDRAVQAAARNARVRVVTAQEFIQKLQPTSSVEAEEDSQANVVLSDDEIDEWLTLFNQSKDGKPKKSYD